MYEHLPVCKVSLLTPLVARLVEVASIYHQILHPEHNRKQYQTTITCILYTGKFYFLAFCPHRQWVNTAGKLGNFSFLIQTKTKHV